MSPSAATAAAGGRGGGIREDVVFLHLRFTNRTEHEIHIDAGDDDDDDMGAPDTSSPTSFSQLEVALDDAYRRLHRSLILKVGTRERLRSAISAVLDERLTPTRGDNNGAQSGGGSFPSNSSIVHLGGKTVGGAPPCAFHRDKGTTGSDEGRSRHSRADDPPPPLPFRGSKPLMRCEQRRRRSGSGGCVVSIDWSELSFLQSLVDGRDDDETAAASAIPGDRWSDRIIPVRTTRGGVPLPPATAAATAVGGAGPPNDVGNCSCGDVVTTPLDAGWWDRPLWVWTWQERLLAHGAIAALDFANLLSTTLCRPPLGLPVQVVVSNCREWDHDHAVRGFIGGGSAQVMLVYDPTIQKPSKEEDSRNSTPGHPRTEVSVKDCTLVSQETDTDSSSLKYDDDPDDDDMCDDLSDPEFSSFQETEKEDAHSGGHAPAQVGPLTDDAMATSIVARTTCNGKTDGNGTTDCVPQTTPAKDVVFGGNDYDGSAGPSWARIPREVTPPPHATVRAPKTDEAATAASKAPQIDSAGLDLTLLSQLPPHIRSEVRLVMAIAQQKRRRTGRARNSAIGRWLTSKSTNQTSKVVVEGRHNERSSSKDEAVPASGSAKKRPRKVMEDFFQKQTTSL